MSAVNLDRMFHPKSVAVVGASQTDGRIGRIVMRNLIDGEFPGEIYPVNPRHKTIWDRPAHPSLLSLKKRVDLAIVATPIALAPQIVRECIEAEVAGAVIISAGGKETGTKGRELELAIENEAKKHSGFRIIGPNCLGIICSHSKLNAGFANHMPLPGKTAFISQSGAICAAILDFSIREQIGFSYVVSLGSMLDVDFADVIDYLGGDPQVNSIVMFVESIHQARNFMSAARAVSRVKPIIALKAGRTRAGAQAAATHTGSLTGEDAVYEAAFKRAGIVRVKTFEELFDCAELLANQPRPSGPKLAIITNAGGPGVIATDALSDYGFEPAQLRSETIKILDEFLPPFWSHTNPVDILWDASPERYQKVVEVCLKDSEVNGLLVILTPQAMTDPVKVAETLAGHLKKRPYPVFTAWMGGRDVEKGREIFNRAGIPTFDTPERAVRAFMNLYRYSQNLAMLQETPPKLPQKMEFDREQAQAIIQKALAAKHHLLNEIESKALLAAYGIPVNRTQIAISAEDAEQKACALGFPVAMKIYSRDITHKTDANGVLLNLQNAPEVRRAYHTILTNVQACNPNAVIEGVSIQPMFKHADYELILGSKRDRDFGPVILFGMGGVMTEVLKDQAIALPPLNRLLARRLMQETKIYHLLEGYRNHPPADLTLLEEILLRLSQIVADFPEIDELDINPLMIMNKDACAVDARVLLSPAPVTAPLHLVISPYPNQYEARIAHKELGELFIRPIRPEDAPLMVEHFETLSSQSIYFRFFSSMKRLPPSMLARFTQVDYDREIALAALCASEPHEKMLGVARIITEINPKHAEFSVSVGDPWQGKGIGAELLKRCLRIAQERGIEKVWGLVLAENTQMLALGRKLKFAVKKILGESDYELTIDLTQPLDF